MACVLNSINRTHLSFGDDVLVIGGGTMGLLHVMLAKLRGVRVILSSPERRTAQLKLSVRQPPCSARVFSILLR
jgi:threonine dehydrogenase-like Zn-dependent dehydrogenase